MKIPIKVLKLTDSPYSQELKDSFQFDDDDLLKQMVQELKNARPSSVLISGYRGVGKTSLVNRLKEALENTLFVNVSVTKYQGYPTLIKKIIRQLYIDFQRNRSIKKNNDLDSLEEKFSLLYDRTFFDVTSNQKQSVEKERSYSANFKFDLKKVVPIIFVLISSFSLIENFFVIPNVNYLIFIGSVIWACISSWDISLYKSKKETGSSEISRKTLYDDEISEHHLFQVLTELKEARLNTIIVFDELDKIKATATVEDFINDIKALLLSGTSNFFVISGQGLYYQLEKSHGSDDPIISSLFSKSIHVPFPRYSSLKKYLINLLENEEQAKDELLNRYFDYLILEAGRVPRKLSNLVRANLFWEDNKASIVISEELKINLEQESKLLTITTKVLDNDLPKIAQNQVKIDFFIAQIHIWLKKIKTYKSNNFAVTDITQYQDYNLNDYPASYISQLAPLCELFFDRLVEENILKKLSENETIIYRWATNEISEDKVENGIKSESNNDPNFLKEFLELEQYVRSIYVDLVDGATTQEASLSIKQMILKLIQIGAFSESWSSSNKLDRLIEVRNKVVHGLSTSAEDLNIIQSSRFDVSRLKGELIEDYTYFIVKRFLVDFKVSKENKGGFDFIANRENISIVFEVKYLQNAREADSRNVNDIIDKFTNYQQSFLRDAYYVLFFYQPNGRKSYDQFYSQFFDVISNRYPNLRGKFFLFYPSEYRSDASTGRLETYLSQVIQKLNEKNEAFEESLFENEFIDADIIIKEKAKTAWPTDFQMQVYEIKKQEEAILNLQKGKPSDISDEEFRQIRNKAKSQWPTDYEMRLYEEQKQIESLRQLRSV